MTYGTVAWYDPQRGVGAITIEDSGAQLPVSSAQIDGGGRQSLQKGSRVAFRLLEGPGGAHVAGVHVP